MKFNNRNIYISPFAHIGRNVKIGDDTVIYDNVSIADNTVICNNCVIGEPLADYYHADNYKNPPTLIGNESLIRSHAIIYAGCTLGENFSSGHRITIREGSVFGRYCRIGTLCDIQGNAKFGDYCWLHSNVFVAQNAHIEDFVFIYPHVMLANDPHPPSNISAGVYLDDFAQIGAASVVLSGIRIGRHAVVAAGSVVTKNAEEFQLVAGNPAKKIKDVRKIVSRENPTNMHYPWPYNFSRYMPWEKDGFDKWLELNSKYK